MPSNRRTRKRRTAAQWTEILKRFESSDVSRRAFCRREGLALSSFERWRSRLGSVRPAEFVQLVPGTATPAASSSWSLEVALPNGVSLRFRG